MIAPFSTTYGTARALGYFAQSEPECRMREVRTLLEPSSFGRCWKEYVPSKEEVREYRARLIRVRRSFRVSKSINGQLQPEVHAKRIAFMKGNRYGHDAHASRLKPLERMEPADGTTTSTTKCASQPTPCVQSLSPST